MIILPSAIPFIGIFLLLILASIVLIRGIVNHQFHYLWLTIFIAILALRLFLMQVFAFGISPWWELAGRFSVPIALAVFPSFYMFARRLVTNKPTHWVVWVFHFLPSLGLLIMALVPLFKWPFDEHYIPNPNLFPFSGFMVVLQIMVYGISFLYRYGYLSSLLQSYVLSTSPASKVRIQHLFIAFTVFMLLLNGWLISFLIDIDQNHSLYVSVLVVVAFVVAYNSIHAEVAGQDRSSIERQDVEEGCQKGNEEQQVTVLLKNRSNQFQDEPQNQVVERAACQLNGNAEEGKQPFGSEQQQLLYQKLRRYLVEDQGYINPDLSLKTVATVLGTNTRYLSMVINHYEETNFQQMLNRYRIDYVIKLMNNSSKKTFTLFGLAQMAGFNSKSTFIAAFRNQTGSTPAEFQKKLKEEEPLP